MTNTQTQGAQELFAAMGKALQKISARNMLRQERKLAVHRWRQAHAHYLWAERTAIECRRRGDYRAAEELEARLEVLDYERYQAKEDWYQIIRECQGQD